MCSCWHSFGAACAQPYSWFTQGSELWWKLPPTFLGIHGQSSWWRLCPSLRCLILGFIILKDAGMNTQHWAGLGWLRCCSTSGVNPVQLSSPQYTPVHHSNGVPQIPAGSTEGAEGTADV